MSQNLLKVSLSPHIHSGNSIKKEMYGVIIAMLPALLVSFYFFGLGAVKVAVVSVLACLFFEYIIQKFLLKGPITITDGSAVITGILLAFNVPGNLPFWVILIGALVAVGVGKMSFGGLGQNLFNPALVGRAFLLISFPVQMTSWPVVDPFRFSFVDASTGATPLGIVKEGLGNGKNYSDLVDKIPTVMEMFMGQMGGSLGEVSVLAVLLGLGYMLYKKIISWHIPVSIMATVFVFSGLLHYFSPEAYAPPYFHLFTGGLMIGSVFMATDMVTSPMTHKGMMVFGVGIGIITVLIRVFGSYPEGISFAILIMNGFVPLINNQFKPKRFGKEVKNGK